MIFSEEEAKRFRKWSKKDIYKAYCEQYKARENLDAFTKHLQKELALYRYTLKQDKIRSFLLRNFDTDLDEVNRCLAKATTIVLEQDMICVMNSEWIYYFGSSRNSTFSRKEYRFMKLFDFSGKKLCPKNLKAYKNHVKFYKNHCFWI